MKKQTNPFRLLRSNFIALIALLLITGTIFAFGQQETTLKVELPLESWEVVMQVIESSNAPYQQVNAVKAVLIEQLNAQITPDSLNQQPNGTNGN